MARGNGAVQIAVFCAIFISTTVLELAGRRNSLVLADAATATDNAADKSWRRLRDRDSERFVDDRLHDSRLRRIHSRHFRRLGTLPAGIRLSSSSAASPSPSPSASKFRRGGENSGSRGPPSATSNKDRGSDISPRDQAFLTSDVRKLVDAGVVVHVPSSPPRRRQQVVKFSSKKTQFWEAPSTTTAAVPAANDDDGGNSLLAGENSWRSTYLDPDDSSPQRRFQSYGNLTTAAAAGDGGAPPSRQEELRFEDNEVLLPETSASGDGDLSGLTEEEMEARFLNIFTVVRFNNTACNGTAGDNGTCYTANECARLGGINAGNCASGFGVCCVFTKTCGQNTSANCTYFVNRGYPSTTNSAGSCQLVVNKCGPNICQLRLDFVIFALGSPDANGVCANDVFTVSSSGALTSPALCGTNTGQSIYIDVPASQNAAALLTFVTSGETNTQRSWKVKITQIPCNSIARAPSGCSQYYTGTTGQISTYNFNQGRGSQLANQDVTYCVRMEEGFCGIQYTVCPDTVNTVAAGFSLTGLSTAKNSRTAQNCGTDWVTIPCASDTPYNTTLTTTGTIGFCPDRLCGNAFNPNTNQATDVPVYSFRKPFILTYHTDSSEPATLDTGNRGFCLNYVQQPCLPNLG